MWPRTRPLLALLLACQPQGTDMPPFTSAPPMTTVPEVSSGSSTGSGGGSSTTGELSTGSGSGTAGASTGAASTFDVGTAQDFASMPIGCKGKIDFLFVISSAGSMANQQKRLLEAFPAFYGAIEAQFPDFDTHILVSDTDAWWTMGDCGLCMSDCDPFGVPPLCGAELTACDTTMGAGVTFPAGKDSSARRCDFTGGRRYISRDDPDPLGLFLCAAQLGSGGAPDAPAQAMVEALSPALSGPGGCNAGFLRDDALLVVTIIADTYDELSKGGATYWTNKLMEAKHGDGDAFLVLVLSSDIDLPPGQRVCPYDAPAPKPRLRQLTEMVDHGMYGSICLDDYGPFFEQGAATVLELCEAFIPQ